MNMKMKIKTFVMGMLQTNCYLVSNDKTKECFFVDPALYQEEMLSYIHAEGLEPRAILLTHGHFDHIMGIDGLLREFAIPVYAHEDEAELLENAGYNCSASYSSAFTYPDAVYVRDGQMLEIAGMRIRVIHTPGHTAGGCCYYIEEEQTLFSGDTLFCDSVGRTDLPTGDEGALVRSIREKLLALPDETRVLPGHMKETSIGYERKQNPYL